MLDEADKAPLEVVCVLKGLVGDGELVLPGSGKRLLSRARLRLEAEAAARARGETQGSYDATSNEEQYVRNNQIIPIHDDFKLIVLANRPGENKLFG